MINATQGNGASFSSGNLNHESASANLSQGHDAPHDSQKPNTASEPDAKSEASYDPLFDDEPEPRPKKQELALPTAANTNGVAPAPGAPKLPSVQAGLVPPLKKHSIPLLDPVIYSDFSSDILLAASIDGQVVLWDRRAQNRVGRLEMGEKCPPWCLSVSGFKL